MSCDYVNINDNVQFCHSHIYENFNVGNIVLL